jgi:hypothetical protein
MQIRIVDDIPEDFMPPDLQTPVGLEESKISLSLADSPLKAVETTFDSSEELSLIDGLVRTLTDGNISSKVDAIV